MTDNNGRVVVLDGLTAAVAGRRAIVETENSRSDLTPDYIDPYVPPLVAVMVSTSGCDHKSPIGDDNVLWCPTKGAAKFLGESVRAGVTRSPDQ